MVNRRQFIGLGVSAGLLPGVARAAVDPVIASTEVAIQADVESSRMMSMMLNNSDQLHLHDRVTTGPEGKVRMRFEDRSLLSIGPNADLRLSDFDLKGPGSDGKLVVDMFSGALRFLSSGFKALKPAETLVRTPIATIGIRGTHFIAIIEPNGQTGCIVLLRDERTAEHASRIEVTASGVTQVVDKVHWGSDVPLANAVPSPQRPWDEDRIAQIIRLSGG